MHSDELSRSAKQVLTDILSAAIAQGVAQYFYDHTTGTSDLSYKTVQEELLKVVGALHVETAANTSGIISWGITEFKLHENVFQDKRDTPTSPSPPPARKRRIYPRAIPKRGQVEYTGVTIVQRLDGNPRYRAGYRQVHLKYFDTSIQAAIAYDHFKRLVLTPREQANPAERFNFPAEDLSRLEQEHFSEAQLKELHDIYAKKVDWATKTGEVEGTEAFLGDSPASSNHAQAPIR